MEFNEKQNNTKEYSKEEILMDIATITYSMENIADLIEAGEIINPNLAGRDRLTSSIKTNMEDILEVLPSEINVLALSKDYIVSRVKKDDPIINMWKGQDLIEYIEELENRLSFKNRIKNFPWDKINDLPWRWK